jgi:hypothetical protein
MEVRWTSMPPNGRAADRRAPGACARRVAASADSGEKRKEQSAAPGRISFGDFWPAPSLRANFVRPILLPAKLSLSGRRQIRRDRIWTAAGGPQGEDQGWSESKVTCRGSATHKHARP